MEKDNLYFIEALLNKRYKKPLQTVNENGEIFFFEKIGVRQYSTPTGEKLYCVLKPIGEIEGVEKEEVFVYLVEENDLGEISLQYEQNRKVAEAIVHDILPFT